MNANHKIVPDPRTGVAGTAVATTMGQPGGGVLTAADVPELIKEGTPLDEIIALELTSREEVERIARELVEQGKASPDQSELIR